MHFLAEILGSVDAILGVHANNCWRHGCNPNRSSRSYQNEDLGLHLVTDFVRCLIQIQFCCLVTYFHGLNMDLS